MSKKIRWGILSTANIGIQKVIPAMQRGKYSEIVAIASRNPERAKAAADQLKIPRRYNSYEELLDDKDIDAIYNPLPNTMHVPWTIRALHAGKHVLCEKPLGINTDEIKQLIEARDKANLKVGEAFMVRSHPQWKKVFSLIESGELGDVRSFQCGFYYRNLDPNNIRNQADVYGGAMMDIGCYPLLMSRLVFNQEPERVLALMDIDPEFKTDRLTSVILKFPSGHAVFTVSTQLVAHQRVQIVGTEKRIEIEIPVNAPNDRPTKICVHGPNIFGEDVATIEFDVCDQYTLQGDEFSLAILNNTEVPMTLEDSMKNMAAISAIFESAKTGQWESI